MRSVGKGELLPWGLAGTLRIDLLGQLEGIRVGQVHVGRGDGKDEAAFPADELQDHVLDLVLNILGLVPHGHLGDAWQVDEGQVQHYRGNQRERPSRARSGGGTQPWRDLACFPPCWASGLRIIPVFQLDPTF